MPRLLVIDDRDQTVEMVHRQLPQFDTVTRCDRRIPCQVCEERTRGCPLRCAHDFAEAAEALGRLPALPDLVVLDLHFALPEERLLPEDKSDLPTEAKARRTAVESLRRRQGLLILEKLRATYPTLPVVMLTTTGSDLGAERPEDPLVYLCENEVVDSRSLAAEISRALALSHSVQEGPIFWGRAPGMAELRRQLEMLARSPLPLLIEGETGTGKSFLAEHVIHPRSGAKGPLVVTDLSTMPPALLAAHLFGTRRGAYTGAVEDHAGVFEQAHGGTLFLDEIANLDLELQRQLLLVLERGTVTRLGDTRPRPAMPKLVAATHEDVEALVHAGRFRADLFMRLNPATRLRVPPLRERRQDLADLVRFAFLEALRSESLQPLVRAYLARFPTPEDFVEAENTFVFGRPRAVAARRDAFSLFVSREGLARLAAHDWPGNHRELKLLAANALVFCLTQHLDTADVGAGTRPAHTSARAPAILDVPDPLIARLLGAVTAKRGRPGAAPARGGARRVEIELAAAGSFARVSADVERQYLRALYEVCAGDLEKMARELLGPRGSARQVHLRLNQLGLRLRDLRGTGPRGSGPS
ncbi:MAG TPA: sigma 54-interacting transcriptional regulator [Polyangia bacterium]